MSSDTISGYKARLLGAGAEVLGEIAIDIADDVATFKKQVQCVTGIPAIQQELALAGHILHNRDVLGAVVTGENVDIGMARLDTEAATLLGKLQEDAAAKAKAGCLEDAPLELLADARFMRAAVQQHRRALKFATPALQADPEIVMAAVRHSGRSLMFAAESLRDAKDIALEAVRQDGWALELLSPRLQDDQEVVFAALEQNPAVLECAGAELRAHRAVVLEAIRSYGMCFLSASPELQADRELAIVACQQDWEVLKVLNDVLRADRGVALAAVKSHHPRALKHEYGCALEYVAPELRADRSFCLEAVGTVGRAWQYLPRNMQRDPELALAAVRQDGMALNSMPPDLQTVEIASTAVRQNQMAFADVAPHLWLDVAKATGDKRLAEMAKAKNVQAMLQSAKAIPTREDVPAPVASNLKKHFDTLGLESTATPEEIRKRYRELVLQSHPDKQGGNPETTKQFIAVSHAYRVITSEALRGG